MQAILQADILRIIFHELAASLPDTPSVKVEVCLTPEALQDMRKSYTRLADCSLVCRAWAPVAQDVLYQRLIMTARPPASLTLLLQTLKSRSDLASKVVVLVVDQPSTEPTAPSTAVQSLLSLVPNLVWYHLQVFPADDLHHLGPSSLPTSFNSHVRRLSLRGLGITAETEEDFGLTLVFPTIRNKLLATVSCPIPQLELHDIVLTELDGLSLPSVEQLVMTSVTVNTMRPGTLRLEGLRHVVLIYENYEPFVLDQQLAPFGKQLDTFEIRSEGQIAKTSRAECASAFFGEGALQETKIILDGRLV